MPIPVAQLQEAQAPLEGRVLRFLESQRGQAFSLIEIYAAMEGVPQKYKLDLASATATMQFTLALMGPVDRSRALDPYKKVLSTLVGEKKIVQGNLGEDQYFAAAD